MLEENFRRQHTKILGQTQRKHLESISEVTNYRRKNYWGEKKKKSQTNKIPHLLSSAPELDKIKGKSLLNHRHILETSAGFLLL